MPNQNLNSNNIQPASAVPSSSVSQNQTKVTPQRKAKIPFQTYLYIFGTIILLLGIIGYVIYANFLYKPAQQYSTLSLPEFSYKYKSGNDFTLVSEISFEKSNSNKLFKAGGTDYTNIKNAALKLGMSKESFNTKTKVIVYTPENVNTVTAGKFIKIDEDLNLVTVNYIGGINNQPVKKDDVYNYLKDLFGLPEYSVEISNSNVTDEDNFSLTFIAKYDDKKIRFNGVDDSYLQVYVAKGKIVEVYFSYLPVQFTSDNELKNLEKINKDTIQGKYYYLSVFPTTFQSSEGGLEPTVNYPIQLNTLKYSDEYLFYKDRNLGILLIPIRTINVNYTDNLLERGEGVLVVINQS